MRLQGWEWIIILAIVLLIWGGPKLPGLAKSLAQSMRIFRKEIKTTDEAKPADKPAEGETPADKQVARKKNPDAKMSLSGHLKELRNRLFWSALFIIGGSVAGWFMFDAVFNELQRPIVELAAKPGSNATINFPTVVSAFDVRLQVSIFLGILMSAPIWLYNLWAFVTPGLKKRERRYTIGFVLASVPLFIGGTALAWSSLPTFVVVLVGFTPDGAANVINASEYILFTIRILLVFGLAFVLPVALVMLNFAGVITAENIIKSWRMAVFVSAVVGAIATPVAEPMAMFLLMVPLLILYFLAAGIAYLHDKRVAKKLAALELADPQAAE